MPQNTNTPNQDHYPLMTEPVSVEDHHFHEGIRTMTQAEYNAVNDPPPGTCHSWDTATEDEKRMFRDPRYGQSQGKTLSDLFRDQNALDVSTSYSDTVVLAAPPLTTLAKIKYTTLKPPRSTETVKTIPVKKTVWSNLSRWQKGLLSRAFK